jgi:hypothetical protein
LWLNRVPVYLEHGISGRQRITAAQCGGTPTETSRSLSHVSHRHTSTAAAGADHEPKQLGSASAPFTTTCHCAPHCCAGHAEHVSWGPRGWDATLALHSLSCLARIWHWTSFPAAPPPKTCRLASCIHLRVLEMIDIGHRADLTVALIPFAITISQAATPRLHNR